MVTMARVRYKTSTRLQQTHYFTRPNNASTLRAINAAGSHLCFKLRDPRNGILIARRNGSLIARPNKTRVHHEVSSPERHYLLTASLRGANLVYSIATTSPPSPPSYLNVTRSAWPHACVVRPRWPKSAHARVRSAGNTFRGKDTAQDSHDLQKRL